MLCSIPNLWASANNNNLNTVRDLSPPKSSLFGVLHLDPAPSQLKMLPVLNALLGLPQHYGANSLRNDGMLYYSCCTPHTTAEIRLVIPGEFKPEGRRALFNPQFDTRAQRRMLREETSLPQWSACGGVVSGIDVDSTNRQV